MQAAANDDDAGDRWLTAADAAAYLGHPTGKWSSENSGDGSLQSAAEGKLRRTRKSWCDHFITGDDDRRAA